MVLFSFDPSRLHPTSWTAFLGGLKNLLILVLRPRQDSTKVALPAVAALWKKVVNCNRSASRKKLSNIY